MFISKCYFGTSVFLVCTVLLHFIIFHDFAKLYSEQRQVVVLVDKFESKVYYKENLHLSLLIFFSLVIRVWFIRKLLIFLFSKRTERNSKLSYQSLSVHLSIQPKHTGSVWRVRFEVRLLFEMAERGMICGYYRRILVPHIDSDIFPKCC